MLKSAQKALKRTTKVSKTTTTKKAAKKLNKKTVRTVAKRKAGTKRKLLPDAFLGEKTLPADHDLEPYRHIPNGPTVIYTPDDLPSEADPSIMLVKPSDKIHPAIRDAIRLLPLNKTVPLDNVLALQHAEPLFEHKLSQLRKTITARNYTQPGDVDYVTDPFGFVALNTLNRAVQKELALDPPAPLVAVFLHRLAIPFVLISAYDIATGCKFQLPGLHHLFTEGGYLHNQITSADPSIVSRLVNATPFSLLATAWRSSTKNTNPDNDYRSPLPDFSKHGPEVRLALVHLQRIEDEVALGTYQKTLTGVFDRHAVSVADVIPNGELIEEQFNANFFMPDTKKSNTLHEFTIGTPSADASTENYTTTYKL